MDTQKEYVEKTQRLNDQLEKDVIELALWSRTMQAFDAKGKKCETCNQIHEGYLGDVK